MQCDFPPPHCLEFDGYIDLGKQLSLLATLLHECVGKLGPGRNGEIQRLVRVLDRVRLAQSQPAGLIRQHSSPPMPGTVPSPGQGEPGNRNSEPAALQALQRNIFRYNSALFIFIFISCCKFTADHKFIGILFNVQWYIVSFITEFMKSLSDKNAIYFLILFQEFHFYRLT